SRAGARRRRRRAQGTVGANARRGVRQARRLPRGPHALALVPAALRAPAPRLTGRAPRELARAGRQTGLPPAPAGRDIDPGVETSRRGAVGRGGVLWPRRGNAL